MQGFIRFSLYLRLLTGRPPAGTAGWAVCATVRVLDTLGAALRVRFNWPCSQCLAKPSGRSTQCRGGDKKGAAARGRTDHAPRPAASRQPMRLPSTQRCAQHRAVRPALPARQWRWYNRQLQLPAPRPSPRCHTPAPMGLTASTRAQRRQPHGGRRAAGLGESGLGRGGRGCGLGKRGQSRARFRLPWRPWA